ncbi:MAG: M23 family metallopeptidase, partial [Actinomycetota bacterium]|nr:M23 family metallopeptidase [Actinomycetota bacterium]
ACPQDRPRSYSDTWGAPRSGGRRHQGTDIFGARGGLVFAITGGVVQFTRSGGNAGLFLSLRGDDGHVYWYMHLQDFVASAGQRVSAGQVIAHNGDTGNARGTSPHIHFEYHPGGGGPVNPYPLVRRVCG